MSTAVMRGRRRQSAVALSKGPKLIRETFKTSREMDFFSEKELTTQTGHSIDEWPLVILKELIDNALDACEEADMPPAITVNVDACNPSMGTTTPRKDPLAICPTHLTKVLPSSTRTALVAHSTVA